MRMSFYLAYLSCSIFLVSCKAPNSDNGSHALFNMDTTFIYWNKATLLSLNRHIESASDSAERSGYQNALLAFKAFLEIDDAKEINIKSIRYQFLDKLSSGNDVKGKFYIIEANRSGETVEIRNYVIWTESPDTVNVDVYNFVGRQWVKNPITKKMAMHNKESFIRYPVKMGRGFNQDDVVITQFNAGAVSASEYYLYTTLPDISPIKEILLLR
jgi:hypothetical protein